jgi:hypothetical protein
MCFNEDALTTSQQADGRSADDCNDWSEEFCELLFEVGNALEQEPSRTGSVEEVGQG